MSPRSGPMRVPTATHPGNGSVGAPMTRGQHRVTGLWNRQAQPARKRRRDTNGVCRRRAVSGWYFSIPASAFGTVSVTPAAVGVGIGFGLLPLVGVPAAAACHRGRSRSSPRSRSRWRAAISSPEAPSLSVSFTTP